MIGVILKAILSGLWKPILEVLAVFGAYGKGRVDQAARAKAKATAEALRRSDAARDAAADAADALGTGMTPADVKRINDAKWGLK